MILGHGAEGWDDRRAVAVLASLAGKLAAVHATGLAIGDFALGHNILVRGQTDPVWCDITAGWVGEPFTDLAEDAAGFFSILDGMAAHQPVSPLIAAIRRKLNRLRERRRWAGGFQRIAALLEPFTA